MNLKVRFRSKGFITESTLVITATLMYNFYMGLQLHFAGKQFSTVITRKHLLGYKIAPRIYSVLSAPMTGQRHGRGIFSRAVLTREGSVCGVFSPDMILQCYCIDETLFSTDLTLIDYITTRASFLMELLEIPRFQRFLTIGTLNHLISILLSVFPFNSMMPLHDMSV